MIKPYYQEDGIALYHGDSREILLQIPEYNVDLVLTDPPYSVSVKGMVHRRQPGKGARNFDFFYGDDDWDGMIGCVKDVIASCHVAEHCSWYVWCGHRQFGHVVNFLENRGLETRFLTWNKSCPAPSPPGAGYASAVELCVYAYPKPRTWNDQSPMMKNIIEADSYRHGVPGKLGHPAQKPYATIELPMLVSSNVGDTVLDPFCGSGTTLRAAKRLGRKCVGIEIEEEYCEMAANSLQQGVLDGAH